MDPYPFNTTGGYPPPIGPPTASPHLPYQTGVGAQQSYPPMPMNTSMMAPPTSSLPPPPMPPFQQQHQQQLTSSSMPMMGYNQSYSQQQPQSQSMVPGPMMMGGMGTVRGGTYPQTGAMAPPPPQTTSTTTTTKTTYYAANASQNFSGAVPSTVNRNMPLPGFPQQQQMFQQNPQSGGYPQQYYK